jgi:NAD(P) transhydrogenase subunit alpha
MIIGILKETQKHEQRVSATPTTVKQLIKSEHSVIIEKNAGEGSFISNKDFENAGAEILETATDIYNKADIIFKVSPLSLEELDLLKKDSTIISFFQIKDEISHISKYIDNNISILSMSHVPRTTLAQNMDALSSQSNIAGYKATIIGADHITKYMPLLMTAAGTIKPSKVLILGAGVAGLAAIANAKRMGAQVYAFDVRPVVKEQVESLGANFIEVESDNNEGVGEGGYAKEVSDDYKKKQADLIKETIKNMDLVISTALIPERPAPILIDKSIVESMKPGSVIIDLAAINGGNCELTQCDEIVLHNTVTIDGRSYLPSTMAADASQLYSKNVYNLFNHIYNSETPLNFEDEITNGSMILNKGQVNNELLQKFIEGSIN